MSPKKIIEISTANMNILPSKKYKFSPEEVEKKSIENEKLKQFTICIGWKKRAN